MWANLASLSLLVAKTTILAYALNKFVKTLSNSLKIGEKIMPKDLPKQITPQQIAVFDNLIKALHLTAAWTFEDVKLEFSSKPSGLINSTGQLDWEKPFKFLIERSGIEFAAFAVEHETAWIKQRVDLRFKDSRSTEKIILEQKSKIIEKLKFLCNCHTIATYCVELPLTPELETILKNESVEKRQERYKNMFDRIATEHTMYEKYLKELPGALQATIIGGQLGGIISKINEISTMSDTDFISKTNAWHKAIVEIIEPLALTPDHIQTIRNAITNISCVGTSEEKKTIAQVCGKAFVKAKTKQDLIAIINTVKMEKAKVMAQHAGTAILKIFTDVQNIVDPKILTEKRLEYSNNHNRHAKNVLTVTKPGDELREIMFSTIEKGLLKYNIQIRNLDQLENEFMQLIQWKIQNS